MIRRRGFKFALASLLVFVSLPIFGQTAADYIKQGNEYFAKFDDTQAHQEYLKAAKTEPTNYEALWKTSRA